MTTKAALKRFDLLHRLGCIACWLLGVPNVPPDIHHLVDKGDRKKSGGDMATIPLCPWHHRGVPFGMTQTASACEKWMGPSLALNKKAFVERFDTERKLLAKVDSLIYMKADYEQHSTSV